MYFFNADDQVNYAAKPVTFIRNTERQVVILNYKSPQGEQEQYEENSLITEKFNTLEW